jgi:SNF2 family DNA or RNA helicase
MGLGKTPTSLAAIETLREQGAVTKPVLIVALSTLKAQWAGEIAKFTDRKSIVISGTPKQRAEQYSLARTFSYVIVNYEQVTKDWKLLGKMEFSAIVCDEVTALKNFRAQRTRRVKALARKVAYRLALTGTPIENGRAEELFSIMEFVDRTVLGDFKSFDEAYIERNTFGAVERYRNLAGLHTRLDSVMVRRTQADPAVAPYLPTTMYRDPIVVPLDARSRKLHSRLVGDLMPHLEKLAQTGGVFSLSTLYGGAGLGYQDPRNAVLGAVMSGITCLRQLCVSPELITLSAQHHHDPTRDDGSAYAAQLVDEGLLAFNYGTPKLDAVEAYVTEFLEIDPSYKVVVFVSWVDAVETLVARFGAKAVPYSGRLSLAQKDANKKLFQEDPEVRVFVSSDAGGYGVNLPQANLLVNVDLPWSAGALLQRNGRIQRVSSEWKMVIVQDFLVERSLDIRQHDLVHQKLAVAGALLDGSGVDDVGGMELDSRSLLAFLKQAIN